MPENKENSDKNNVKLSMTTEKMVLVNLVQITLNDLS